MLASKGRGWAQFESQNCRGRGISISSADFDIEGNDDAARLYSRSGDFILNAH
jgi:hypothetical protein